MLPVLHAHPNAHLMLVGDESPPGTGVVERIRNLVDDDPARRRVHLVGGRPHAEVLRLLQAADIFAHPSREEAFGLAVLEAMSAGLPIVAWDDGALPELVVDGETGLLPRTGDIAGLGRSLDALISDADLRRRLGQAGRERMERHFDPDLVAPLLPRLLSEVAGSN